MNYIETLNEFFVGVFNKILAYEENSIKKLLPDAGKGKGLSVRELHVIEAVYRLVSDGANTMTNIARSLSLSPGAASTAVTTLVKKGFLCREAGEHDRRRVYIFLTPDGERAERVHNAFHSRMISEITTKLTPGELESLAKSLGFLGEFFA